MKKAAFLFLLTAVLVLPSVLLIAESQPTRAPRSGDYPINYEIQDYEPSGDEQWDLDVAQDQTGRFYAVWGDFRDNIDEIRFSKSSNGTSWGDGEFNNNDKIVSDGPGGDEQMSHPSIAVDSIGRLYCIWLDDRDGDTRVRMSTSNNSGSTWTPSSEITEISGTVTEPYIRYSPTVGLSIVYVEERTRTGGAGPQKDIMFTRSTDGGKTFSDPIAVNDDPTDEDQLHPRMVVASGGRVGIVWEDYRNTSVGTGSNSDIYLTFTTNGEDFSRNIEIGASEDGNRQQDPDLAFSSKGDLMVVWQEMGLDGWRIRYSIGWLSSPSWDRSMDASFIAVRENLTRLDQFSPRVGYVNGAFFLSWAELDINDFYLIRTGYISREGEYVSRDHIVDDSIDWGMFINDPIYHAEMYRETVIVHGFQKRPQVFWMDHRTDTNPSNKINEDADPYTARAFGPDGMPLPPQKPQLRVLEKSWSWVKLEWDASSDVELKGYYLTYGIGSADDPDENLNDASVLDRLGNEHTFQGLKPDTLYEFKLMVKDRMGNQVLSNSLKVRTDPNQPPLFSFIEPDGSGDTADTEFVIRWSSSDREDEAYYTIHYDDDLEPSDQVFLFSGDTRSAGGDQSFIWNTTGLEPGGYTINATIDDGVNEPITTYSKAVIVSHPGVKKEFLRVLSVVIEGGRDLSYVDPVLEINFDNTLATSTLVPENLFVLDKNKRRVEGIISILGARRIQWRPSSLLGFGEEYTLVITPMVMDFGGNKLDGEGVGEASSYNLKFTTRSDAGAPFIRDHQPQGTNAPLWPDIRIRFDIPMAPDTMSNDTVRLKNPLGRTIPISMEYSQASLELAIRTLRPLEELTSYKINLSKSIISQKGSAIMPYEWSFTTTTAREDIDTDSDGVPDDRDWFPLDPSEDMDTDIDGRGDNRDEDDDNDGMPDEWEIKYGLDPKNPSDATGDLDDDGKTNLIEFREGTNPKGSSDSVVSFQLAVFIVIALAVVILAGIIIYSMSQRRKLQMDKMEKGFFREEYPEE
ncbi:MAG: Ig-like domain-containing protein [Thermoplasmatota archaeon]